MIQFIRNPAKPNGVYISVSGRPLRNDAGVIEGCVLSIRDITEKRKRDEALKQLNETLERNVHELDVVNKELESFSYSVSHDLRSPLRSIIGFSNAVLEKHEGKLDEETNGYLIRINNSAQRMGQLIDGLLELSRLTRGNIEKREVNVSEIAKNIISDLQAVNRDRKVLVNITDKMVVQGDGRLLQSALINLLNNAWKFTAKQKTPCIEFGKKEQDGKTVYFVRDNGAGFDMKYAEKLFKIFQRLHGVSDFEGNGIGLATVQRIIQRHGGKIWAESAVNEGTTFYFTI
jgi:light-regulated signal transduction histidine kinase (bacteriophytochrome)